MSNLEYYERKLNEIPKDILTKAVEFLKTVLIGENKEEIIKMIEQKGLVEWATPYHFNWGMYIRNALRSEAKLLDDLLPDNNWDDYYIQCVEIAVGKRNLGN